MQLRSGRRVGTPLSASAPARVTKVPPRASTAPSTFSSSITGSISSPMKDTSITVKTVDNFCGFCGKVHQKSSYEFYNTAEYKSPSIFNSDKKDFIVGVVKQSLANVEATRGRFLKMSEVTRLMEFISDNFYFINSKEFHSNHNFIKTVHDKCIELGKEDTTTENSTEKVIAERFVNILKVVKDKTENALVTPYF